MKNIFTVTFDQMNESLLNKIINFFKNNKYKLINECRI